MTLTALIRKRPHGTVATVHPEQRLSQKPQLSLSQILKA